MAAFGGYWRPLAAVARLLEELGELGEELAAPPQGGMEAEMGEEPGANRLAEAEIAAELADLWIITAALADQYLATVAEPHSIEAGGESSHVQNGVSGEPRGSVEAGRPSGLTGELSHVRNGVSGGPPHGRSSAPLQDFVRLVAAAGLIARIVNFYDGPKTPRSPHRWISIEQAIAQFHQALASVAVSHHVDLRAAVLAKLSAIPKLDSRRFSATSHDPSTAPCLRALRSLPAVVAGPLCDARLWGGPEWREESIALYADAIAPSLLSFAKAAEPERLHAYVISGPPPSSPLAAEDWASQVLAELQRREPQLSRLTLLFDRSSEGDDLRRNGFSLLGIGKREGRA